MESIEKKDVLNIALVCMFPFPIGLAATVRIIAYMRGLKELGNKVTVYVNRPTDLYDKPTPNGKVCGSIEGVQYIYPGTRRYSKYKLLRGLGKFYYPFVTCKQIYKSHRDSKIDFLLMSNDFLDFLFLYTTFARIIGVRPVFVSDEYPQPIRRYLKPEIPKIKKWAYSLILRHVDSMVFMTKNLNLYYNSFLRKPFHILPSIVDTSRFENLISTLPNDRKYLCYMGNMELAKDNVDNIICAFKLISSQFPDIDLRMWGKPADVDRQIIESCIKDNDLEDRCFLMGYCPYEEVPNILSNAYVLVSSQPNTKRAQGGFPTKLAEYMCTGKPVLLTDVGEISSFVHHREHVFLAKVEDVNDYALKLKELLDNYNESIYMAKRAKEYVLKNYSYLSVSEQLFNFLINRKNEK